MQSRATMLAFPRFSPRYSGLLASADPVMSLPGPKPMNAMTDSGVMKHRLTVDDYYRMAEVGVLAPDARVELIEGEIIDMASIGSRHAGTVMWLHRQLFKAVGDAAFV